MSTITNTLIQVGITTFVTLLGKGDVFPRVIAEVERLEDSMPEATGKEKRDKFFAECEVIFDDIVIPIASSMLRLLLELGVTYLKANLESKN